MNPTLSIPTLRLSNGLHIPAVGFGTSKIQNSALELRNAIKFALKSGYRHIDCASSSSVDTVIKEAIKAEIIETDHQLTMHKLFLTIKLWNHHHSPESVQKMIKHSLASIGVEYFDLMLINSPMGLKEPVEFPGDAQPRDEQGKLVFSDVHYLETYGALEQCARAGQIKSLGLCNFNIGQLENLLNNCNIKPVCNQIEVHPYFQNDKLVNFCQNNQILVIAYSPFADSPGDDKTPDVLEDATLIRIASKYKKTPAQVCLRWCFQRKIATIPRAIDRTQIIENAHIFDFFLTDCDMLEIKKLNRDLRIHTSSELSKHPHYPFNEKL